MSGYSLHFLNSSKGKRKCKHCDYEAKFESSHKHSSNLRNHIATKHPALLQGSSPKVPKLDDYFIKADSLPSLPAIDRQAIAACCSNHVLPFDIVEDKMFQWAYDCQVKSASRLSNRISELAEDWRQKILSDFKGRFLTIMLDGWTNPINGQSHMCYMISDKEKLYYWKSLVVETKTAQHLADILKDTIQEVVSAGATVICCVGDNARNIQASFRLLRDDLPSVLAAPCCAHILNLLVGDIFKNIVTVKESMKIVDNLVRQHKLPRYVVTRWNSRYTTIVRAYDEKLCEDHETPLFEQTKQILREVASQIDVIQADDANVVDVLRAFKKVLDSWDTNLALPEDLKCQLKIYWSNRWQMFSSSCVGVVSNYLRFFLFDEPTMKLFEPLTQRTTVESWAQSLLPADKYTQFQSEMSDIQDIMTLGTSVVCENFPIHRTLSNLLMKMSVSEACVERAFSKHKLFHTNLRASLKSQKLDDQLFLRYNFENIMKVAQTKAHIDLQQVYEPFDMFE
jgi:hypothetical protein